MEASQGLLKNMDVSGTIDAILGQKGREIFAVSPDTTVYAAIELMAQRNVGALVVVENGLLIGLLSERDYTRKITLRGKRSRETPVREIMSSNLTTVTPREPVENWLANDDRETNSTPAGSGGGHTARSYFDRRLGQVGYRQSIRCDCSSRELYLGWLFRVSLAAVVVPAGRGPERSFLPQTDTD